MWINADVDLPEPLVVAQSRGTLAIFAGAGVSMGAPSNLPDFEKLALQVAGGGIEISDREPIDRFLGRAEARGTDIQARTRAIIGNPASHANPLHQLITRLFRSANDHRLITTNFDRHFTSVLREEHQERVPLYCAPALPLGQNFSGLVYLHGSVDNSAHLVLTDADFGRAYLTEGWATRFLFEVFRTYTVLFVGYSHRDPVIGYLARSIVPGGSSRFALVSDHDDGQWDYLGITAIRYPTTSGPAKHSALSAAFADWVRVATMGVFDHEQRIRELTSRPPPVAKEDIDYLVMSCGDAAKAQYFVDTARGPAWLEWTATHGFLDHLFSPDCTLHECERLFTVWLAKYYAADLPQPLLDLIQERGGKLNGELWLTLCRSLALARPPLAKRLTARWIVVLLHAADPRWPHLFLDELLKTFSDANEPAAAMALWRHLSTPRVRLARRWIMEPEEGERAPQLRVELYTLGDQESLEAFWREFFLRNLGLFHSELAALLTSMLHEAHAVLRAGGEGGANWDSLSLMRSAIEPHPQDKIAHDTDLLINAARDVIEWLLSNNRACAAALREQWLEARTPILRRLGIHGLTKDNQSPAEEAIQSILSRHWLYELGLKHEVFQLLKAKYALTSEDVRKSVLAASLAETDLEGRQIGDYERFNLAVWLHEVAPECPLTVAHLEGLQALHPAFTPREYPDLNSWGGDVQHVVPRSPVSLEELLAKAPADAVSLLATFEGQEFDLEGPDREGLLAMVREAAASDLAWTTSIIEILRAQDLWVADLWAALLGGLAVPKHSREDWTAILKVVSDLQDLPGSARSDLLDLLKKYAEEDVANIDRDLLTQVIGIARRASEGAEHEDTVFVPGRKDWLTRAINHVGGKTALVIVQALGKLRQFAGDTSEGIPGDVKHWIEALARDDRVDAQRARTVLAANYHFFFTIDQEWTTSVLLPFFDWRADVRRAEQAWFGYIAWGRWNDAILESLRQLLEESFGHIARELGELRNDLSNQLAGMALYSARNPWHNGWLIKFIRDTDGPGLQSWAWAMGHALERLKPEAVTAAWASWLRDYWEARATGVPRPFEAEELSEMLDWTPGLVPVLDEAVQFLVRQPIPLGTHSIFMFRLQDSPILESHPEPMGRLLAHLLANTSSLGFGCGFVAGATRKLHAAGAERETIGQIVASIARLGCVEATQLRTEFGL